MKRIIYIFNIICLTVLLFLTASEINAQKKSVRGKQSIQKLTIYVKDSGYELPNFNLKRGIPARITIIRQSEYECGEEIVFPALNIKRKLPLNKPVVVNFTPRKTGSLNFTCGMDMMRGKLIVEQN